MRLLPLLLLILFVSSPVEAGVDLPWSTTFDCSEWAAPGNFPSCDGMSQGGDWSTSTGNYEQITSSANNPNGGMGRGQRHWVGVGTNNNSGGIDINLNTPQTEVWIRWYMRWQAGKQEGGMYKLMYLGGVVDWDYPGVPQHVPTGQLYMYSANQEWYSGVGFGNSFYESGTSDGTWVCMEIHMDVTNKILQWWVDGNLVVNDTHDYGSYDLSRIRVGGNQKDVLQSGDQYCDYDDIAINNTGYIGPLGSQFTNANSAGGTASASGGAASVTIQ